MEIPDDTIDVSTLPNSEKIHPIPSWDALQDNAARNGIWSLQDDAKSVSFIALGKNAGVIVDGWTGEDGIVQGTEALLTLAMARLFNRDVGARFSHICDASVCADVGNYLMAILLSKKG